MTVTTTSNSARTFDSIATANATTTTLSITGIPQTYTDLRLIINAKYTSAPNPLNMTINGSTGQYNQQEYKATNYMSVSSGANSYIGFANYWIRPSFDNQDDGTHIIDFIDYTSVSLYKSAFWQGGSANGAGIGQYTWLNTSAITSITVTSAYMNISAEPFSMSLYGIKGA
jgi:hypothetical protein